MRKIEVGNRVKILSSLNKLTVVEINGNIVDCEIRDDDGYVHLVKIPKSVLVLADVGFLDIE